MDLVEKSWAQKLLRIWIHPYRDQILWCLYPLWRLLCLACINWHIPTWAKQSECSVHPTLCLPPPVHVGTFLFVLLVLCWAPFVEPLAALLHVRGTSIRIWKISVTQSVQELCWPAGFCSCGLTEGYTCAFNFMWSFKLPQKRFDIFSAAAIFSLELPPWECLDESI